MGKFTREELEQAFRTYWRTGAVGEDWDAWAGLFTEDCLYVEHMYGTMRGRLDRADHGEVPRAVYRLRVARDRRGERSGLPLRAESPGSPERPGYDRLPGHHHPGVRGRG